jgi:hypothetical protein
MPWDSNQSMLFCVRIFHICIWHCTYSIPDEVTGFFSWPNPASRTMALESTQPLTEMSTRNLPGGKGRLVCGADNLTAICELTF